MVGVRIKELRLKSGMTQLELSGKLSLTPKMISFYELGERQPPNDILIKLSSIFDVSADYILGLNDNPMSPSASIDTPNDEGTASDPDIRRIQRAKKKMPEKEWERHMKIVEAAFGDYYADDYAVTDLDE